jgi:predicted DNA-binding transcriptional regulator AlpA
MYTLRSQPVKATVLRPETIMFPNDTARFEATLTLADLIEIYCVSKRTIWRWVAEGRIPRPYAVSRRIRRWKANEIQQHLDGLPRATQQRFVKQ